MYAVIFKAEINKLDSRYTKMAEQMRTLAMEKYGREVIVNPGVELVGQINQRPAAPFP